MTDAQQNEKWLKEHQERIEKRYLTIVNKHHKTIVEMYNRHKTMYGKGVISMITTEFKNPEFIFINKKHNSQFLVDIDYNGLMKANGKDEIPVTTFDNFFGDVVWITVSNK